MTVYVPTITDADRRAAGRRTAPARTARTRTVSLSATDSSGDAPEPYFGN
jgi:hypothetical protein